MSRGRPAGRRGQIDDVGQKLHQPVVFRHATIDPHHRNGNAITGDGGEQIFGLIGHRFQRRADEIGWAGVARDAIDSAARMRCPVRRLKAGEGGHHIDAVIAVHGGRDALGFSGGADEFHPVAKPLHNGADTKIDPSSA